MSTGQLAQSHGDQPADEGSQQEAEDDSGSGDLNGRGRSQQQAGPDRTAHRYHGHLTCTELMMKALFVGGIVHGGYQRLYQEAAKIPKNYLPCDLRNRLRSLLRCR